MKTLSRQLYCNGCFIAPAQAKTGRWIWMVTSDEDEVFDENGNEVLIDLVAETLEDLENSVRSYSFDDDENIDKMEW